MNIVVEIQTLFALLVNHTPTFKVIFDCLQFDFSDKRSGVCIAYFHKNLSHEEVAMGGSLFPRTMAIMRVLFAGVYTPVFRVCTALTRPPGLPPSDGEGVNVTLKQWTHKQWEVNLGTSSCDFSPRIKKNPEPPLHTIAMGVGGGIPSS